MPVKLFHPAGGMLGIRTKIKYPHQLVPLAKTPDLTLRCLSTFDKIMKPVNITYRKTENNRKSYQVNAANCVPESSPNM